MFFTWEIHSNGFFPVQHKSWLFSGLVRLGKNYNCVPVKGKIEENVCGARTSIYACSTEEVHYAAG
jgi:hypothetical protein